MRTYPDINSWWLCTRQAGKQIKVTDNQSCTLATESQTCIFLGQVELLNSFVYLIHAIYPISQAYHPDIILLYSHIYSKDNPFPNKNVLPPDRLTLVTGSILLNRKSLWQKILIFQNRWSLMAVVSLDRFHCTCVFIIPGQHSSNLTL